MTAKKTPVQHNNALLHDLRSLIEEARSTVATTVNVALTTLYWRVGKRISEDILQGERANYGKAIVATVSRQLVEEFGSGFAEKSLAAEGGRSGSRGGTLCCEFDYVVSLQWVDHILSGCFYISFFFLIFFRPAGRPV